MALKAHDVLKHSGKTGGKSNKLGGGGRFKQMERQGKSDALIAWIGRRKHGAKAMAKMSAKGRKRANHDRDEHDYE